MSTGSACLLVADESQEFPAALAYASTFAARGQWRLILLRVIPPAEPAPWASVGAEMKRQSTAAAEQLLNTFCDEVRAEGGHPPECLIREGDLRAEIKRLIEEEQDVKLIVLAAGAGPGGPGPLVSALAKGQGLSSRPLPAMIVPGALTKAEARALASGASA